MCGLVGYFSIKYSYEMARDLDRATDSLSARGPDGRGTWTVPEMGAGLGHRRLAVIDLTEAAGQPMFSPDKRFVIVYNGEVYNFKCLRAELESLGHEFITSSDTEVILNAYRQWGQDCLQRFVGMFAFAIWDLDAKILFLARDRLGIKPLYFFHNREIFAFASELKALMAFRTFPRNIKHSSLRLFLHYQYVPAPETIFENTYKLLPGHWLKFEVNRPDNLETQSYWQIGDQGCLPKAPASFSECVEILDGLVTEAVSDRLVSDVPLGALLSGGIDSSIVASVMQKVSPSPIRTFSIGFSEHEYNEAPYAKAIAAHLGTEHTELYVTPDQALAVIPRLAEIYDEPFADSSAIPTHLVSILTRSQVTVALTGDGGDEQFAGYVRYWMTDSLIKAVKKFPPSIRRHLASILALLPQHRIEQLYRAFKPLLPQRYQVANFKDKWQKLLLVFSQQDPSEIYRMTICLWSLLEIDKLTGGRLPASRYDALFEKLQSMEPIRLLMKVDQQTYLPDCMLTKVDRASMAAGLEIRVPLLDHRLVAFSSSIPLRWLYRHGSGKYILKKLLERYLPRTLFERPKMGFGVPIARWLRGNLREMVLDCLSPTAIEQEGFFDCRKVDSMLSEHMEGRKDHHHRIWSLLMWQLWKNRWLNKA